MQISLSLSLSFLGAVTALLGTTLSSLSYATNVELQYRIMTGKFLLFDIAMVFDGTYDNPKNTMVVESRGLVSVGETFVGKFDLTKDTLVGAFIFDENEYFRYKYVYDNTPAIPKVVSLVYDGERPGDEEEPLETSFPMDKWQGVSYIHALHELVWVPENPTDASVCPPKFQKNPLQIFTTRTIQQAYTKPATISLNSYKKKSEKFLIPPTYACEFKGKTLMGSKKSEEYYERTRFWFAKVQGVPIHIPVYGVVEGTFVDNHAILKSIKVDGKQMYGTPLELFDKSPRMDLWKIYEKTKGNGYPYVAKYNPDAKED